MDELFTPDTQELMDKIKIINLHHVAMELSGVIAEFRAMPCDSLERRMFATLDRYKEKLKNNAPSVTLGEWNAHNLSEHEKWVKFTAEVAAENSSPQTPE